MKIAYFSTYTHHQVFPTECTFKHLITATSLDIKSDDKLTVMFYIHGGGWFEGAGNDDYLGPDFLLKENVILVTINYRLAIFGFLSLGTAEFSGNMGLKDQRAALRWVNENIHYFGGDTNKITVFGHSAGSGSSHLQLLSSPSTKGLFQRMIAMSGTALNSWAIHARGEHIQSAYAFGTVHIKISVNKSIIHIRNFV